MVRAPLATEAGDTPADRPAIDSAPTSALGAPLSVHGHLPGTTFGLEVHEFESDERVARYVRLFSGPERATFVAQLGRGTRYETMIRARLRAAGLPDDLYYLALVESGYEPHAVSRVSAVGMWQFMAGTARDLGLRMDGWVDERRDPVRATDAAVRNLKWLRSEFGSNFLAAAAYNGGPTRVARGLARLAVTDSARTDSARADSLRAALTRVAIAWGEIEPVADIAADVGGAARVLPTAAVSDATAVETDRATSEPLSADARFFALSSAGYLRTETKNYVPQLIAALLVAREPARYGIEVRPQTPFAYDSVRVPALTPLAAVASAAGASRDVLLDLNPHLLRGVTPPGAVTYVRVPLGTADSALRRFDEFPAADRAAFRELTAGRRETIAALASRAGVSASVLRRYNPELRTVARGKNKGRLVAGQSLRVPTREVLAYALDVPDAEPASPTRSASAPNARSVAKATATSKRSAKPAKSKAAKSKPNAKAKASPKARPNAKAKAGASKSKPNVAKAKPNAKRRPSGR